MRSLTLTTGALSAVLSAGALAGDDIVITGGNRLTGEIQELSRGKLDLSIDGVQGTSEIAWDSVESLVSPQRFELFLANGDRLSGVITLLSSGQLEIQTDEGRRTLAQSELVHARSVGATFFEQLEGSVDLGLDFLKADDEIDWTLNAEATHRARSYLTEASISSLLRRRDGATAQRRTHFDVGSRRFLERRWFALGTFLAEEDRELGLESRFLVGVALGRAIVQTNQTSFAAYGGVDVSLEKYDDLDVDHVPELLAGVEWDWFAVGGNFDLLTEATTYYDPDEGRVRFELEGKLRYDLFSDYFVSLNLFESYNSEPPEGFPKSDFAISLSLGRTF